MTPTALDPSPRTMRYFCTYFDRNYLTRGLALYDSLVRHCRTPFVLWALCLDEETLAALAAFELPHLRPIAQAEFEEGDEALRRAKANRNKIEYYWTCTPSLPLHLLRRHREIELIAYVDADVFFYADPAPLWDELGKGSVLIMEHRYPALYARWEKLAGKFNVEFLIFRRDPNGMACLERWRNQCLEWCGQQPENGKYGDQKYLDDWPAVFRGVVISQNLGAGLAPWNMAEFRIDICMGRVCVAGHRLVFYHFHSLRLMHPLACQPNPTYTYATDALLATHLPYARALRQAETLVRSCGVLPLVPRPGWRRLVRGLMDEGWLLTRCRTLSGLLWTWGRKRAEDGRLLDCGYRAFQSGNHAAARAALLKVAARNPLLLGRPGALAILLKSLRRSV